MFYRFKAKACYTYTNQVVFVHKPCCYKRPVEILINRNAVAQRRNVKFDSNILAIGLTKVRYSWYFKHSYIVLGDLENDQFCDLGDEGVLLGKRSRAAPLQKAGFSILGKTLARWGTLSLRLCHCILNLKGGQVWLSFSLSPFSCF